MHITRFDGLTKPKGTAHELDWSGFVEALQEPCRAKSKDRLTLFSPASFTDDKRSRTACKAVHMLVIDVDNAADEKPIIRPDAIARVLKKSGVAHVMYDTWSSCDAKPKYRVCVPLAKPIPPDDWRVWYPAALSALGLDRFAHAFDASCLQDCARAYFWPARNANLRACDGEPLDVPVPEPQSEPAPAAPHVTPSAATPCGKGDYTTLDVVAWFAAHGAYIGAGPANGTAKHNVRCPWEAEHTGASTRSATVVYEADGGKWPTFHCLHAHCTERGIADVMRLWGDADSYCRADFKPKRQAVEPPRVVTPVVKLHAGTCDLPITIDGLLERYYYVSGMNKILDMRRKCFMSVDDMRNTFRSKVHFTDESGKEHPVDYFKLADRVVVHADDLRFAPGAVLNLPLVNLFDRLPFADAPRIDDPQSRCEHVLALIHHIACDDVEWVLDWLAYPIRYLGAKMRTALVVHGRQGTGKSLIFGELMGRVYGRYGVKIGQLDLDSGYNGWMSCRCYCVAEEVGRESRGKWELAPSLKDWITARNVTINEKYMPARSESNCCNLVFLSNDSLPVALDPDDRRYFVIGNTKGPMDPGFYAAFMHEINNGGDVAWYQYLRERPVQRDFADRPTPMTAAKAALIETCKTTPREFVDEWSRAGGNEMGLPHCTCENTLLYQCYGKWCVVHGHTRRSHRCFTRDGLAEYGQVRDRARYMVPPGHEFSREDAATFASAARAYLVEE